MASKRELFVGGPRDGARLAILHGDRAIFQELEPVSITRPPEQPEITMPARHTYYREALQSGPFCMYAWRHESIEPEYLLAHIIAGYRPEN